MEPTATDPTPATGHYHRITLATDGSKDARAAAAALGALPWEAGTSITVVGVVSVNRPSAGSALPMTGVGQDAAACHCDGRRRGPGERHRGRRDHNGGVGGRRRPGITSVRSSDGIAAAEILAQAWEDGPIPVVAGAKGYGTPGAFVLGSVSEASADRSGCLCDRTGRRGGPLPRLYWSGSGSVIRRSVGRRLRELLLPQGTQIVAVEVTDRQGRRPVRAGSATHLARIRRSLMSTAGP